MKSSLVIILFFLLSFENGLFGQNLEVGPLTQNVHVTKSKNQFKILGNTFDSTFIFLSDTIQLPFFDDFSTNKFQQYTGDINAPGVTSELFYRLTNPITLLPIDNSLIFTGQVTFKRTFDIVSNSFSDSIFGTTTVRVGDLSAYPPQYSELNLYPPYFIFDTINDPGNMVDTVWIINPPYVQDSARIFFQPVNDPQKIWIDDYAFHNYRFAKNPRSLGVVTFDGLDETGYPYEIGTAMTNYADRLTSKPIDLQDFNTSDSLYFSFLYQPEGLGDIPENGDSLIVEFYAPELQEWNRVWGVEGNAVHDFRAAHVLVNNAIYFKKGFQFRFRNYGSLAGGLDHFHIDYVHLRILSAFDDTLFKDFAFVYPLNSLLETYTSVPWDHYKESIGSKMTDSLLIKLHNGSPTAENYQNGQVTVRYTSSLEGNFVLQGFNLAESNINYNPRTTHTSYNNCSNGYEFDRTKPGIEQSFEVRATASAQFPNFTLNDSTLFYQKFYNYYSYDDGTAEAAFGPTGTQARLAIEYSGYQADSLIGVNIHFVPSVTDVSSNIFLITVWDDNNGKPGSVIYEDDVFFPRNPQYGNDENVFVTYYFKDTMKVAVGTKFHIGWRQLDGVRLNAGLDRNIDNSSKIRYSVDGGFTWLSSPFPGSAMIRPVFSTALDAILGQIEIPDEKEIILFPNPSSNVVHFMNNNLETSYQFTLYNSMGQFIESNYASEVNLGHLESGIYFIEFPKETSKIFKIVKQ
jgi:hypothetical protein